MRWAVKRPGRGVPQRNSEEQEKLTGERLKGSDDKLGKYYRIFGDFARVFTEKEGPAGGARREENARPLLQR